LTEKGKTLPDPRPTFLVQNMANPASVFNVPYSQSTYSVEKNASQGLSQRERMAMPKLPSPHEKQMYTSAMQKMTETVEMAVDYNRYINENSAMFVNYKAKLDGQDSLKTLVKTEPLEDNNCAMSSQYRNSSLTEEGATFFPAENNATDKEMNLVSIKTENVDNDSAVDADRTSVRPVL
jgi:hypothetical protein